MTDSNGSPTARPRGARRATQAPRARAGAPAPGRRRPLRAVGCAVAGVVVLALVAAIAGAVWWTFYRAESDVPPGRVVEVEVPKGASGGEVGRLLAEKGVVRNATMFGIRARSLNASGKLKPGVYELTTGSDYDAVIRLLEAGPTIVYHTLTIPEGWTIDQIAARVQEKTGISASEFSTIASTRARDFDFPFLTGEKSASLQGYLFPKTYQVREGSTAEQVIRLMLAQYGRETAGIDMSYARSRNLTPRDVLIIASIIEREASVAQDRPLVASVIYNRLKAGMRLQLDSTVMYILGNRNKLYTKDLKVESPYNTYLHAGLPPGPIANPGIVAIDAAAAPARTSYLYYIMDHKDGSQSFAATYEQFLKLKAAARSGLK